MAKFCGNCGSKMDDSARVCGNCGTPFNELPANIQKAEYVDPEKKKESERKMRKTIGIAVTAAALILVAVIVFNVVSAFTGCNGLVRKVMSAYEDYDIDALLSMSSDVYYYGTEDYAEYYFENAVGYGLDSFESNVGHSFTLSYEVNEIYTLSNRKYQSILDELSWQFSEFDTSIIEEIAVADITVTAQRGSRSVDRDLKITLSKEDGTWKVLFIE